MKRLGIIIIITVLSLFTLHLVIEDEVFSENENKNLAKFPEFTFDSLFKGEYIKNLENYITDHFPFRDTFLGIKSRYELLIGKKEINDVYIGKNEYLFEKYNTPKNTDKLIEVLNKFKENNLDTNMNLIFVPSSGLVNKDKLPDNVSYDKQEEVLNKIYSKVNMNNINILNRLIEKNKEKELFFRLDHHYNIYGAYYTYLEFCKKNNIQPVELKTQNLSNEFTGTLYSKTNIYSYTKDIFESYTPDVDLKVNYVMSNRITKTLFETNMLYKKDKYSYYLNGNHPLIEITTDVTNKKEILIVKDSFANSLIPFLVNHYSKIHVIDPRFYNLSVTEYITENNIENVLIIYGINGIDNDTGIYNLK